MREPGPGARVTKVTRQSQVQAAAEAETVDGRDAGSATSTQLVEENLSTPGESQGLWSGQVVQLRDVGAGGKISTRTGDDDGLGRPVQSEFEFRQDFNSENTVRKGDRNGAIFVLDPNRYEHIHFCRTFVRT